MTLMMVQPMTTQTVRLESLKDGPGLLPFKLGPTRLVTHYHSFLQYIELSNIEDKITALQSQLNLFREFLVNDTFALYELQIEYLYSKLNKVKALLRTLEPNRAKRGLLDGLGSLIKSISGNLDYTDAIKYNKAIKVIEDAQNNIISEFNSHISISKEWMNRQTDIITQLVENQSQLNATLLSILDSNIHKDSSLIKYAKFGQLLTIIAENVEDVLDELIRIENSLAFIRTSSTHHSMLSIDEIDKMIGRLTKIYIKEQIIELELRQYYDIIRPGYYYYNKQIVIVFKLPIASVDYFDMYKLAVFPNRNMQAIFPPSPYTLTNRRKFMYIEAECPKYNNKWYLCEEKNNQLRTSPDCTQNLIFNQTMDHTCEMTTITLSQEAMEELDSRHYILSFPHPTQIHTACEREDFVTLNGSFLATIPANCILSTKFFIISNTEDKIAGQPLKILDIYYEKGLQRTNSDRFKLKSINLRSLYSIQDRAMVQPTLSLSNEAFTFYHTTIPFYVILSSSLALISGIFIIRRYGNICCKSRRESTKIDHREKDHQEQEKTENCSNEDQFPATFFHSVLK